MRKIILTVLLICGLATSLGCGGYEYLLRSAEVKADIANQLSTGVNEYHTAAQLELTNAEQTTATALHESLLRLTTLLAAGQPIPPDANGKARTPDEIITQILALHQQSLTTTAAERVNENARHAAMQKLLDALRTISAKDAVIVMRQQNDMDQLKALAQDALLTKFQPKGK